MKKFIVIISLLAIAFQGFAQNRGYEGSVYVSGVASFNNNFGAGMEFTTSHGVGTRGGAFFGGGVGAILGSALSDEDCYLTAFLQMKQTFFNQRDVIKPFCGISAGVLVNSYLQVAPAVSPEIGFSFGNCSLFTKATIGDLIMDYNTIEGGDVVFDKKPIRMLSVGLSYSFGKVRK